ncbi:MAG: oxygenase MpaB family protein [Bacteroidota bacterium]
MMYPTSISHTNKSYENRLQELLQKVERPVEGFFGPGSMTWKVFREPIPGLGGLSALLLQIAHPAVGQGVYRYSNFRTDTLGRARRTFQAMSSLIFGNCEDALKAARQMYRIHGHIKGSIGHRSFRASDPNLLLWIQATLIDTIFTAFQTCGRPLSQKEKEQYYEESKTMAILMGIPPAAYPPSLRSFERYYADMINGLELHVSDRTLELAHALFKAPFTIPALNRLLATALLPSPLRAQYGLLYTTRQQKVFRSLVGAFKLVLRILPGSLGYGPSYHLARYRLAQANGRRRPVLGFIYKFLSRFVK